MAYFYLETRTPLATDDTYRGILMGTTNVFCSLALEPIHLANNVYCIRKMYGYFCGSFAV